MHRHLKGTTGARRQACGIDCPSISGCRPYNSADFALAFAMSEIFSVQLTAAFTAILGVGAIVTAILAFMAWRKQSREVRDQAEMLRVQSEQLGEQRKINAKQTEVLELQAKELGESLEERKRAAEEKRRSHAALVTAWFTWDEVTSSLHPAKGWGATIRNASDLPVFDVRVTFNYIAEQANGREWAAVPRGTLVKPVRVFPPLSQQHHLIPDEVRRQIDQCSDDVYAVSITFTDAAGNRWERDAHGTLSPRT
jgi:hypothetical protein